MDLSGSWAYIENVAQSRLAGNKTSRHVSKWGNTLEILGVAGEIAVRRYLGLPENVHNGFDHGVDLTFNGKSIDVKTTVLTPRLSYRYLQYPVWKKIKSEIIILTAVNPQSRAATIVGYATREEILRAPVNRTRLEACHEIPVRDLHPIWELIAASIHPEPAYELC